MPLDREKLLAWKFNPVTQTYSQRDAILYALGIGLGRDPLDQSELQYVYEKNLMTLPTFAVTLATLGMWVRNPEIGITWKQLVQSAQRSTFHRPLPGSAQVTGEARISEVWDRGHDKGAVVVVQRTIKDSETHELYCTLEQSLALRADGGFGGSAPPRAEVNLSDRAPDKVIRYATAPGQAIIYRLSGDWNPLHIDPDIAAEAGFSRPILHGNCSYGIAGWVACLAAGKDCIKLSRLECQFSGPVVPGDEMEFRFWEDEDNQWLFQARTGQRVVLNRGLVTFKS